MTNDSCHIVFKKIINCFVFFFQTTFSIVYKQNIIIFIELIYYNQTNLDIYSLKIDFIPLKTVIMRFFQLMYSISYLFTAAYKY